MLINNMAQKMNYDNVDDVIQRLQELKDTYGSKDVRIASIGNISYIEYHNGNIIIS